VEGRLKLRRGGGITSDVPGRGGWIPQSRKKEDGNLTAHVRGTPAVGCQNSPTTREEANLPLTEGNNRSVKKSKRNHTSGRFWSRPTRKRREESGRCRRPVLGNTIN